MKLILVPVGTSLRDKEKIETQSLSSPPPVHPKTYSLSDLKIENLIEKTINVLSSLDIQTELKKRNNHHHYQYDTDQFPAEISSLLLFLLNEEETIAIKQNFMKKINNFSYHIKLLISDTEEANFCAKVIRGYFNKKVPDLIKNKDLIKVESLTEDGNKFNLGLKNLLTEINSLIKNNSYSEIIFNVTSGFKGIIPYLTLAGMCYQNTRIIYLYETSQVIVSVPKLPVSFDISSWNDNRAFLKALPNVEDFYSDINQLPISAEFKNLFKIQDNGPVLSPFGKFLSEEYESRKNEKSLSDFGRGYILADLIQDEGKRQQVKNWINHSHFIWYGDNIPETVDHSRGHCQRLHELAAQTIMPFNMTSGQSLLNDDELIVLVTCLWFHDIGQSGRKTIIPFNDSVIENLLKGQRSCDKGKLYDISDFSEAVRELHSVLGFIKLLKEPDYYHFSDNKKVEGYLPVKYLKAAALSYLYHRKTTPLNEKSTNHFSYTCTETEIKKPIKEYQKLINQLDFSEEVDIEFITALQTIIDECDNSKERAGDEEFIERRKAQTKNEILSEYRRLKYLSNSREIANYHCLLKYFKDNSGEWKDNEDILKMKVSKGNIDGKQIKIFQKIDGIITGIDLIKNPQEHPMLTEFIKCYGKIIFKLIQKPHFDKSGIIDSVFILPEKTNDKLIYKIVLDTNHIDNKGNFRESDENIDQLKNACNDIIFILKKVDNALKKKGLYFKSKLFFKNKDSKNIQEIKLE